MKNIRSISIYPFILMGMFLIFTNSCKKDNNSQVPELTTNIVSIVSPSTVSCGGNITNDGGATVTDRGVCWSTNQSPTIADSKTEDGTGTGSFTSSITGLTANITYYVRAYATNKAGTAYGNELIFTVADLPTVTTSNFFNVKGSSAEAGGIVANDGGSFVTNMGLCWSTNPNPTIANSFTTQFNLPMTGLLTNTVYYYRAYATNAAGTAYGNQISFNSGYLMGSTYGGGLVFYNDGNAHGLVCADSDQIIKFAKWGCEGTTIGGTSNSINSGASNTNAIVANCPGASIAARVCNDLILNTYDDWYLPSIDELNLMYLNLHTQGMGGFPGFSTDYNPDYWSSSEYDKDYAWGYDFLGGNPAKDYKESSGFFFNVRAVRSF
jgi:hypothetical protein